MRRGAGKGSGINYSGGTSLYSGGGLMFALFIRGKRQRVVPQKVLVVSSKIAGVRYSNDPNHEGFIRVFDVEIYNFRI